jgi:hypothetical protein
MSKNKIDFFTINIWNDRWNVYKISSNDNVTVDEYTDAEINFESKEITFKVTNLIAVIHECVHLYFHYTFTSSADLTGHQVEEMAAEIFAHKGEEIQSLAKEIYNKLKEI